MKNIKTFGVLGIFCLIIISLNCNISSNLTGGGTATTTYQVGGVVFGLASGDIAVLQNNSSDNVTITGTGTGNDPFAFPSKLGSGESYYVTLFTQPLGKTCVAGSNLGTVSNVDIATVQINCSVVTTFTAGGNITGLSGTGLVLKNTVNGGSLDFFNPNPGATGFAFPTSLANGDTYNVSVLSQPTNPSQNCAVSSGSGTIGSSDVTNISVTCTTNTYTIGGSISGLQAGDTIVLSDGIMPVPGSLTVNVTATGLKAFNFPAKSDLTAYTVSVTTPPSGKSCAVTNATGSLAGSTVNNIIITCSSSGIFTVGGTATASSGISGLEKNATIVLNLTSSTGIFESLSVTNGTGAVSLNLSYNFQNTFANGASVTVSIAQQPVSPHQNCVNAGSLGPLTISGNNVVLPEITCTTTPYTVSGNISGLSAGDTLDLRLDSFSNGSALPVQTTTVTVPPGPPPASKPFSFTTSTIPDGSNYTITVTSFTPAGSNCGAPVTGILNGPPSITIVCAAGPTVSVTVSGLILPSAGLGLRLNGDSASNILVSTNTTITFTAPVLNSGDNYSVSIYQQPDRLSGGNIDQQCILSPNATGTLPVVGPITVTCAPIAYAISGNIIGLVASEQAVVYNNTTNNGQIIIAPSPATGKDPYVLPSMNDGSDYHIRMMQTPPGITCSFSSGTDTFKSTIWGADSAQDISCRAAATSAVSVTVINLTGTNTLSVTNSTIPQTLNLTSANNKIAASFASQSVGAGYVLTLVQPMSQTCAFVTGSASGTLSSSGNSVIIDCNTPAPPDFSLTLNSVSIEGGGLSVSYTIINLGGKTAVNPVIGFWADLPGAPTDTTGLPSSTVKIYEIVPTNTSVTGTVFVPIGALVTGTLYAYADYNGVANGDFPEISETNNASGGLPWSLPDLTIAINAGGITGTPQQTITVAYTITNSGAMPIGPFVVDVWVDAAAQPGSVPPCCGITRNTYTGLAAGATLAGSRIIPVTSLPGGTAYVSVDSTTLIPESNENNNVSPGVTWTVTAGPPIVAEGTVGPPITPVTLPSTGYLGTALNNTGVSMGCISGSAACSFYVINGLTAGSTYNIQLTNVSNDIDFVSSTDAYTSFSKSSSRGGVVPEYLDDTPTSASLWLLVDPWANLGGFYTISYNPTPTSIGTGKTSGNVNGTNSKYYELTGLTPGFLYLVTLTPDIGTGDVDLNVHSGPNGIKLSAGNVVDNSSPHSVFLPVDLQCASNNTGNVAESCLVAIPASSTSMAIKVTGVVTSGYTLTIQ